MKKNDGTVFRYVDKKYYTYIVKCADGTYYTGKTHDLEHRVNQHNGKKSGGAKYTQGRRPVELVYSEVHDSNLNACKREQQLKKLPRHKKIKLFQT